MKRKLVRGLLSDIVEMLLPLIFDIAIAVPIVFFNSADIVYGTEEVMDGVTALMHTLKATAMGISIDIIWVYIWSKIKKD